MPLTSVPQYSVHLALRRVKGEYHVGLNTSYLGCQRQGLAVVTGTVSHYTLRFSIAVPSALFLRIRCC